MGDFYVDDQFFDHPKALAAGEDAANLYVRGLAWAHTHNTGLIPKAALGRLTSKKGSTTLAQRLTVCAPGFDNPLWHDEGDHWRIHDWDIRNAKSIAKREQAKSAAKERWRKHSERNADASVSHSERSADAMPYQPRNQGTKEPRRVSNPPPPLTVVRTSAQEEAARFLDVVADAVARRQLATALNVRSPSAWLASARASVKDQWGAYIAEHASRGLDALVDFIEPAPPPPKRDPNSAYTTDDGRTFLPGTGWVS